MMICFRSVKAVESMEKFFLGRFLPYNELNVVYKKDVYIPVFFTEFGHCGIISVSDGLDQFVGKFLTCHIENFAVLVMLDDIMSDGMHKMSLAKSCSSVDKRGL